MKITFCLLLLFATVSCNFDKPSNSSIIMIEQASLNNSAVKSYAFLDCMYQDSYFPTFLVDKCKHILLNLCFEIETKQPANLEELYQLTHASTNRLNDLEDEFFANDSEIETAARECLGVNFEFIAKAYGFDADVEELIGTRNW